MEQKQIKNSWKSSREKNYYIILLIKFSLNLKNVIVTNKQKVTKCLINYIQKES